MSKIVVSGRKFLRLSLLAGTASSLISLSGAYAQSAEEETASSTDDSFSFEEIVITARKRAESLQDVPISVTALQGDGLAARGVARVKNAVALVPNVSLSDAANSNSNTNLTIRGISTNARNVGFESGVSVYVDGVFTGRPLSFNQDFVDIDRVEVLRGPQGTLFGKNTIAGAISITTKKPDYEFGGQVSAEYGSFDNLAGSLTLNMPVVDDKLAVRVSAYGRDRDGIVTNVLNGDKYNDEGSWGGRVQVRFEPNERLTFDLSGDYLDENRTQAFPEVLDDPAAPGPRSLVNDYVPVEERTIQGLGLTGSLELANGSTLTSITGYRKNENRTANDNDNTAASILIADFADEQELFTQEIRLVSPGEQFIDYALGLFYLWQDSNAFHRGIFGADFPLTGGTPVNIDSIGGVTTKSYAAYGDFQVHLTDQLTLLAGLRYTHEKKALEYSQLGSLLPGAVFEPIPGVTDSLSDNDLSPLVGLSYQPNEDMTVYGKVTWGYKSGGWNADFVGSSFIAGAVNSPDGDGVFAGDDLAFQPEKAINYELGWKAEFAGRKVVSNLAVFYTDYSNLQVSQFLGVLNGGTVITNAGKAEIKGAELELVLQPSASFRFDAAIGYVDATFDEYANCTPAVPSCAGNELPNSPKWTTAFSGNYSTPVGETFELLLRAEYQSRASSFTTPENLSRLYMPSYGIANGYVTLSSFDGWDVSLDVKNIFDKDYITGAVNDDLLGTGRTFVGYGLPRTYRVSVTYRF